MMINPSRPWPQPCILPGVFTVLCVPGCWQAGLSWVGSAELPECEGRGGSQAPQPWQVVTVRRGLTDPRYCLVSGHLYCSMCTRPQDV